MGRARRWTGTPTHAAPRGVLAGSRLRRGAGEGAGSGWLVGVFNKRGGDAPVGVVHVGRLSRFRSPFVVGRDGTPEAIAHYRTCTRAGRSRAWTLPSARHARPGLGGVWPHRHRQGRTGCGSDLPGIGRVQYAKTALVLMQTVRLKLSWARGAHLARTARTNTLPTSAGTEQRHRLALRYCGAA